MNPHFPKSQPPYHYSFKPNKKRLSRDQLRILEESFCTNPKLKSESKLELAQQLGVSPKQIAIWYQNRRARHKTETKEQAYTSIQQELGNVLAEKVRLEKEVCSLKYELKKVQEMLGLATEQPATYLVSGSVSDGDLSDSYSPGYMPYKWPDSDEIPGVEDNTCVSYHVSMFEEDYTCVSNQSLLSESVYCNNQETYRDSESVYCRVCNFD